jgi:hypothetical protein
MPDDIREKCVKYLGSLNRKLIEKKLNPMSIQRGQDIHAFYRINIGRYNGNFLHLQAYPSLSDEKEICISANIKQTTTNDTVNIEGYGWQKKFSWDKPNEVIDSLDDIVTSTQHVEAKG